MSFGMNVRRSKFQGGNGRRLHYSVNCIDIAIEGLVMKVLHSKVLRGLLCIGSGHVLELAQSINGSGLSLVALTKADTVTMF